MRGQPFVAFTFGLGLLAVVSACQTVQVAKGGASAAQPAVAAPDSATPTNLNAATVSAAQAAAVSVGRRTSQSGPPNLDQRVKS